MKKILSIPIIAMLLFSIMIFPGCDSDDFKFDLDNLKQSLFNMAIDQAVLFIETELIGSDRDLNVAYLANSVEGWLEPLGILGNSKADGWEDVIGIAYDIVATNIAAKVKDKLMTLYPETWETYYEGADPSAIGLIGHEDFLEFYDEVVDPLG